MYYIIAHCFGLFLLSFLSPSPTASSSTEPFEVVSLEEPSDKFGDYWYQGKAEIASYELDQARYGENHPGYAVLVFVSEDFSRSKQVKLDKPSTQPKDAVKVMKLNFVKKFNTGIYQYSTMQSIFTPIYPQEEKSTLKVSTSIQEWCGHTFLQLNLKPKAYAVKGYSYFEKEGDQAYEIQRTWLEDELFNRIRLNPKTLPTGKIDLIPSTLASRLQHYPLKAQKAQVEIIPAPTGEENNTYFIQYLGSKRSLRIFYQAKFPHKIMGWEESTSGSNGQIYTTKARLKKSFLSPYWQKNHLQDRTLRAKLGIP